MTRLPPYCIFVYMIISTYVISAVFRYLFSFGFSHSHLFKTFISNTPKGILLSFIYFPILSNNVASDHIFLVLFSLLHTRHSKQRTAFYTENRDCNSLLGCSPLPTKPNLKNKHGFCTHDDIRGFK